MQFVKPNWPAPKHIHAGTTTRIDGVSTGCYASLNLGNHVGDDPKLVLQNRRLLREQLSLPNEPAWLNQTHSSIAVYIDDAFTAVEADASYTDQTNQVCAVMTADCLPVLVCNQDGTEVAAIHAGWGGLGRGVIEAAIKQLTSPPETLMAWLGPAIGPAVFEVGRDVYDLFVAHDPRAESGFTVKSTTPEKWLMDIYHLGRQRLNDCGIEAIYGGDYCTYSDSDRFFSYRRDGVTGRMASLIWIAGD